jgi:hypothetical protein
MAQMEPRYRLRENFCFVTDFPTPEGGILGLVDSWLLILATDFLCQAKQLL